MTLAPSAATEEPLPALYLAYAAPPLRQQLQQPAHTHRAGNRHALPAVDWTIQKRSVAHTC